MDKDLKDILTNGVLVIGFISGIIYLIKLVTNDMEKIILYLTLLGIIFWNVYLQIKIHKLEIKRINGGKKRK